MKHLRNLMAVVTLLMLSIVASAQVTTSSLRGHVEDESGPLMAATVQAVHQPSGTKYYAMSDENGNFFINNMRIGGPYTVTLTFIGYQDHVTNDITLVLGEEFIHNVRMSEDATLLGEVVITSANLNPVFNSARTGAMTSISAKQINSMPSISRSITDFTRLTPQANGGSFAGRDGRMNNVTIDGGAFRNNFGLSNNMMPGGSAQPISLDAIETVSVNIAPYDVRLSQFTGASVNAVTKSGTNTFNGTAYTYQVGKGMSGKKVGDVEIPKFRELNEQTYGFSLGGPIVKDKLFFFVNAEYGRDIVPYTGWSPSEDGKSNRANNIARTTKQDMKEMKDFLMKEFGYDPGLYDDFPSFDNSNYKVLAKVDWNINDNHKLALRYNFLKNTSWSLTNATSAPISRSKIGRISEQSVAFSNAFYSSLNTVHGFAGELNSTFGNNASNKLMVTYTGTIDPERKSPSALFPFVEIYKDGDPYMAFGYELFTFMNKVTNNTLSISDDFTYNLGKHTFLAGLRYDNIYVHNNYVREGTSFYRYNSMDDFYNYKTVKPAGFGISYGYDGKDPEGVELNFGLLSAYLQDEIQFNTRFKLTGGIRFELPMYHNAIPSNPAIDGTELRYGYKVELSTWPKPQLLVNPRLGFNWDVMGDRSIQLRGGVGMFSGLMPFVWFTNQPTASGTFQSPEIGLAGKELPDDFRFNPDHYAQVKNNPDLFPYSFKDMKGYQGHLAMIDKDFKMPQLLRTNIAADFALPFRTTLTLEALYSKDIYAILQKNANLKEPVGTLPDGRPYYNGNRLYGNLKSAIILGNTNQGYQASFTVQLRNQAIKGLDLSVAYTYFNAKDLTNNPGSNANSAWVNNHTAGDINEPELSYSQFAIPHRVVGSASYRIEYGNFGATTIGLYYNGSHQGRGSYLYGYDMNGDGVGGDLLYVPTGVNDTKVVFSDMTRKGEDKKTDIVVATAEEQYKAYMDFIESDPYLKERKGQIVERFGALHPWLNRFDLKLMQEFYTTFGTDKRYTVQVSLDFINFGNLLNSNWGVQKRHKMNFNYGNIIPLSTVKYTAGANPKFQLNAKSVEDFRNRFGWDNVISPSTTWKMQLGVRLIF